MRRHDARWIAPGSARARMPRVPTPCARPRQLSLQQRFASGVPRRAARKSRGIDARADLESGRSPGTCPARPRTLNPLHYVAVDVDVDVDGDSDLDVAVHRWSGSMP